MLRRRTFLASSIAAAVVAASPRIVLGANRRFARPRAAKDADHAVVYRNDREFCGWPYTQGFWEASNGDLLQHFLIAEANYNDPDSIRHDVVRARARVASILSRDRGRTWDRPRTYDFEREAGHEPLGDSIAELGKIDFTNKDLFVWSFSPRSNSPESRPYVRISTNAGMTWSSAYSIPLDGLSAVSANASQLVRPDGRSLLFLTWISEDGAIRRPMVYGSTPDNSTWRFMSYITPKDDPFSAADGNWATTSLGHRWFYPRGLMLPNGRILCTLRCQRDPRGVMWTDLHYSDDGGNTWGFLSRVNDYGAPGSLVRMQDGRLVCVYGYRLPPYGIRACVSEDEGRTWGPEIVLRDDGGSWDLGYPNAIEAEPGKIMAIYAFNAKQDRIQANGGVRYIARTIFTVD